MMWRAGLGIGPQWAVAAKRFLWDAANAGSGSAAVVASRYRRWIETISVNAPGVRITV
jgi:hypothetical protein